MHISTQRDGGLRFRKIWFLLGRVGWCIIFLFNIAMLVVCLPNYYFLLSHLCTEPQPQRCPPGQLSSADFPRLQQLGMSLGTYAVANVILHLVIVLIFLGICVLMFWKSREWLAWFVSLTLTNFGVISIVTSNSLVTLQHQLDWRILLAWTVIQIPTYPLFALCWYIFPSGRFVPRWSWIFAVLWIIARGFYGLPLDSPFSMRNWPPLVDIVSSLILFGSMLGTQIYRYQHVSDLEQRQQTKWVVFGLAITVLLIIVVPSFFYFFIPAFDSLGDHSDIQYAFFVSIPLSFGFAILRYRLWDIDILINRTLVYVGLSASVIGLYVLVVMSLGTLFQAQGNLLISLLATGMIAVLFQPLRERLQRGVNRLMFGERDEPYRVLARLGQRLETTLAPETVLPTIVEMVAQALKLPFAAIAWTSEQMLNSSSLVAVYGETREENLEHIPLVYQTETVGSLMLAPRQRGEQLTPADRRFLSTLASQIAVATHAMRLTVDLKEVNIDLQRSREQLVTTREEERRRLRRDLHDGLGPTLAALNLQVGALRTLIAHDPTAADALAVEWRAHLRKVIADIRSLVYALRPPALDELGLLGALREQINQYRSSGVKLMLNAPEHLPPLAAAVEVACYRIALEALTNVVRHAHAHTCTVHLTMETQLILEVIDDGRGLPPEARRGVGLNSMRERAEELGGTCELSPGSRGGLCVRACLPLSGEMPMNERMKGLRKITLSHF